MDTPKTHRVLRALDMIGSGGLGALVLAEEAPDEGATAGTPAETGKAGRKVTLKILSAGSDPASPGLPAEVAAALVAGSRAAAALGSPGIAAPWEEMAPPAPASPPAADEGSGSLMQVMQVMQGGDAASSLVARAWGDKLPVLGRDHLAGPSLLEYLNRAERPDAEGPGIDLLRFGGDLAAVLTAAHAAGVRHGDLHPGNVIFDRDPDAGGGPVLTDFGAAAAYRILRRAGGQQEQGEPGEADEAADDVHALGAILQQLLLLTGGGVSTAPTLPAIGQDGGGRGALPARDLRDLLRVMMAPNRKARPTMAQVAMELTRLGEPTPEEPSSPDLPVSPGQCIGSYRLLRKLGAGGMGVVFEAQHARLSRSAAIKILRPEFSLDPEMVKRFYAEAESVNIVRHPGIVNIFEFGELPDGTVFIVMEYLQGESLHHRMNGRPQPAGPLGLSALRLMRQVASALAAAHEHGIVHRDLKPENVMIIADPDVPGGERAKLLDFGIAKMAGQKAAGAALLSTQTGRAMGTPLYMSPEQCRDSGTVDDRADVYSLGVRIYEVLAGQPPFRADGFAELASLHFFATPRPLPVVNPAIPRELVALVEKMLAKVPADRPRMTEVAAQLEEILAGGPEPPAEPAEKVTPLPSPAPPAEPVAPQKAAPSRSRRRPVLPLAAGLAALAVAAVSIAAVYRDRHARHAASLPAMPPRERPAVREEQPPHGRTPGPAGPDLLHLRFQALLVLEEGLHDGDGGMRRRAVAILGQSRDARHAALLQPLLGDGEPAVRTQAALALARLAARGSAPAILAAITPPARAGGLREEVEAAGALVQLGEPAGLARLQKALRGRMPEARRRAVELLAEHGDHKARPLVLLSRDHTWTEGRVEALGRLARAGDAAAKKALLGALQAPAGPLDELRLRIAEELARADEASGRTLLEELARQPGPLQLPAARTLASLDDPTYYPLFVSRFAEEGRPLTERILAAEGLGACGRQQSAEVLGRALPKEAGPLRLRMAAAGALLQIAASDPALLAQENLFLAEGALDDERWQARQDAVASLGDAEPRLAVPLLGQAIRDRQPEVRQTAARALGRTRARAAVPVLGEALDDQVRVVRKEAMHSIGQVGRHLRQHGERVDDLVGTVQGRVDRGDEGERVSGVSALVDSGDTSHRAELKKWLRSRDPEVRRQAIEALSVGPDAETDKGVLVAALHDPVPAVRFTAASRLAALGAREGVPVLEEALRGKGPDALIAQGLLHKLGDPAAARTHFADGDLTARLQAVAAAPGLPAEEAQSLLFQGARDPAVEVRQRTAEVAGALADVVDAGEVRKALAGLLTDPDPRVRTRAGTVLARLDGKGTAGAEARDAAQVAYARGDYRKAIELGRPIGTQQGLLVVAAAACRLRDAQLAMDSYGRLEDVTLRRSVLSICQRAGLALLPRDAEPTAPPEPPVQRPAPQRPATAGPRPSAPEERPITNDQIKLPPKALHGTIEIDK